MSASEVAIQNVSSSSPPISPQSQWNQLKFIIKFSLVPEISKIFRLSSSLIASVDQHSFVCEKSSLE